MSGTNDRHEREDRAFDALIVFHLLRDRDINNLDDLPQLSESQRAAMNAIPSDIVDRLWEQVDSDDNEDPLCEVDFEATQDAEQPEFVGMNRAENMDQETKKRLDDARKLVREAMRLRKKGKGKDNADS